MTLDHTVLAAAAAKNLAQTAAPTAHVGGTGRARADGAPRALPAAALPAQVTDTGRIRVGGSCRILPQQLGRS